jgi:hypothetical protein
VEEILASLDTEDNLLMSEILYDLPHKANVSFLKLFDKKKWTFLNVSVFHLVYQKLSHVVPTNILIFEKNYHLNCCEFTEKKLWDKTVHKV